MKSIPELDAAIQARTPISAIGVGHTFIRAYQFAQKCNNDELDFYDTFFETDVPGMAADCKRFQIKSFTISSPHSNMADSLWALQQLGCRITGMTQINSQFKNYETGAYDKISALRLAYHPA